MVPELTSWPAWRRCSPLWKAVLPTRSKNCTVISSTSSFSWLGDSRPRPRINRRSRCASAQEACWPTAEKAALFSLRTWCSPPHSQHLQKLLVRSPPNPPSSPQPPSDSVICPPACNCCWSGSLLEFGAQADEDGCPQSRVARPDRMGQAVCCPSTHTHTHSH